MKAYTSRSRFDEQRRFTGVFQQMGRVSLDADWNEEVRLRTTDARRRTADLAEGSPDDGFRVTDDHLIDGITSLSGFVGEGLPADDDRVIPRELTLDRRDPVSLPFVVRTRGHVAVRRTLTSDLDLGALPHPGGGTWAASELVWSVRFERPPTDDEVVDVQVLLIDADGAETAVSAGLTAPLPEGWKEIRIDVTAFAGVDTSRIRGWGVSGLPPRARAWIDGLRAIDPELGDDVVLRGGDGTVVGAGRLFVDGVRAFLESDSRYGTQPDYPEAPALPTLPTDGSQHHLLYADLWEDVVTTIDDPDLAEPALDGDDTTVRLRLVAQVKALTALASTSDEVLPDATGGGALTTNVPAGSFPDRFPADPVDPQRDGCLSTGSASTGEGYRGSDNAHVRVEVLVGGTSPVVAWSRDNASMVVSLAADAAATATTLSVRPADAERLRVGDLVTIEDRITRLRQEAPNLPVLRRLRGVDPATGTLELEPATHTLSTSPAALVAGGAVGRLFATDEGALIRRWDGADWLLTDQRYALVDGITFRFSGTGFRAGDHWSFTARVVAPDGASRGVVQTLTEEPVHGPVHRYVPLARVRAAVQDGQTVRQFEDLRPRYLPLTQVRERLRELELRHVSPGAFTVVVGDGVRTHGDIDQDLLEGVTGDEALQAALDRLGGLGGSIFVRAGSYRLERAVLLREVSGVEIRGDGEACELRVVGAGGAFFLDRCGASGAVRIEGLRMVEAPLEASVIGADAPTTPVPVPEEEPLSPEDLVPRKSSDTFLDDVALRLKTLKVGEGRAASSVVSTLVALRRLQRENPGESIEDVPAAAPLLKSLRSLPHGVVSIADSERVSIVGCDLLSRETFPEAAGVFVTGTCDDLTIANNRISAASGVVAAPYAAYMSRTFIAKLPRAGLFASALRVRDNVIVARGASVLGISLADGRLDGFEVEGNEVSGFVVGIEIDDRADLATSDADRSRVASNVVVGSTAVGIRVAGDGVDVCDNEVRPAGSNGLLQAAVQITGRHLRVRDGWYVLPSEARPGALGLCAGVLVGDGIDDARTIGRSVDDVEIESNRIDGPGDATPAIGVAIGGPQAIVDVRVRGNVLRDLGGPGVRAWSAGAPILRVRVEENRVEGTALAAIPSVEDVSTALQRIEPTVARTFASAGVDRTRPRPLLEALLAESAASARAPLDGVLRWIGALTLRGGIVLDGVDEARVVDNTIRGVGRGSDLPSLDGAEVHTAAIACVGGSDAVVEGNHVEDVRAPVDVVAPPAEPTTAERPKLYDVLEALGLGSGARIDRADVHLAAAALRRQSIEYSKGDDATRQRLGRSIYGAIDSLVRELGELGGTASEVAAALDREQDAMREAQSRKDHTIAAARVRASLSRAASLTAHGDDAQDAWDAATQYDLAAVAGSEALKGAAERLQDAAATLASGLDASRTAIESAMAKVLGAPTNETNIYAGATALQQHGELRDAEQARVRAGSKGDLFGASRAIVGTFAEKLQAEASRLTTDSTKANLDRVAALRGDKDALVEHVRKADPALAERIEGDWRGIDRTDGRLDAAKITRVRESLTKASELAARGTTITEAVTDADAARVASQGEAALVQIVTSNLDKQVAGLVAEPAVTSGKGLRLLQGAVGQLRSLVDGDPELEDLASKATSAVKAADDPQRRVSELSKARGHLDLIRQKVSGQLPTRPTTATLKMAPVDPIDRRLAALGALAYVLRGLPTGSIRTEGLDLFQQNLERALSVLDVDGSWRTTAVAAVNDARGPLGRSKGGQGVDTAIHGLATQVELLGARAAGRTNVPPATASTAVLLRALREALDPSADEAARVRAVQEYVRTRTSSLTASVAADLSRRGDLDDLTNGIAGALERLARGDKPSVPPLPEPVFTTFPRPATGLFAAGVAGRLRMGDNLVDGAVTGAVVRSDDGHVLASVVDEGEIALVDNRFAACMLAGLDVRLSHDAVLIVEGQHVFGCGGLGAAGPHTVGQAVALVTGRGHLVLAGSTFHGNGARHPRAVQHEILVDWRGEATVRGNVVRHVGGEAGGAGVLVLSEVVPREIVRNLTRGPFLAAEAPPKPKPGPTQPTTTMMVPDFVRELAFSAVSATGTASASSVMRTATARVAPRALLQAKPAPRTSVAASLATSRLSATKLLARPSLADKILPTKPPPVVPKPPPANHTIHVEGNDVAASGPALLLLAEDGGDIVSATVTGNTLVGEGGTGAAYLRHLDATVFAGNRCQCLDVVPVVVIRAQEAPIAATGNVVVGAEPVTPPPPPAPPPKSGSPTKGGLSLNVPLFGGASVAVPLKATALLGALDRKRADTTDAFAKVLAEWQPPTPPIPPAPEAALEATLPLSITSKTLSLARTSATTTAKALYTRIQPTETTPEASIKKAVDLLSVHGVTGDELAGRVKTLIEASGNDPTKALDTLEKDVIGIGAAAPTVKESLAGGVLLHDILADAVRGQTEADAVDEPEADVAPIPRPPPDPHGKSLVVFGGSSVACVGNATTAGVLIQDAATAAQLDA